VSFSYCTASLRCWRGLCQRSMEPKISAQASARVRYCRRFTHSCLRTPKKLSAAALSAQLPTALMLQVMWCAAKKDCYSSDVYWQPRL